MDSIEAKPLDEIFSRIELVDSAIEALEKAGYVVEREPRQSREPALAELWWKAYHKDSHSKEHYIRVIYVSSLFRNYVFEEDRVTVLFKTPTLRGDINNPPVGMVDRILNA